MIHKKSESMMFIRMRHNFKQNKKWFILSCILQFLGFPVFALMYYVIEVAENSYKMIGDANYIRAQESGNKIEELVILQGISMIFFCVAILVSIFIVINIFSYLHQKTKTDMIMSLPMSTKQRFWSDFLSGLVMYVLPYLFSLIPTGIILGILDSEYGVANVTGIDMKIIIFSFVYVFLIMLMLYAYILFVLMCCGTLRGTITYIIATNVIIPAFFFVISTCIATFSDNEIDSLYAMINYINISSPFGGLFFRVLLYDTVSSRLCNDTYVMVTWGVKYIIVTMVIIFIAYLLYKKRKSEDTGKFLVYKFIYHVLGVMIVIALFGSGIADDNILLGLIWSSIVYVVFSILASGKVSTRKNFTRRVLCYFVIVVCTYPFMWILEKYTDNVYSLPESPDVLIYNIKSDDIYKDSYYSQFVTRDKDIYDKIINVCSQKCDKTLVPLKDIEIYVVDKIGNISSQCYHVEKSVLKECMYDIWTSQEYREMIAESFEDDLNEINKSAKRAGYGTTFAPEIQIEKNNSVYSLKPRSIEEFTELAECYRKDILNISEETMEKLMYNYRECYILRSWGMKYVINDGFENTIKFFEEKIQIN